MTANKDGAAILGVGVAACAVCCAGPILGFLAAIGVGTAIGFALFGLIGLAIAVAATAVLYRRRRRRRVTCTPEPGSAALAAPTRRPSIEQTGLPSV